jgi:hypothetical protein
VWEFEFLTAGIWRLSSFKMWRSVFWSKSTNVAEKLISSFLMAEYLEDGGSFFAESKISTRLPHPMGQIFMTYCVLKYIKL